MMMKTFDIYFYLNLDKNIGLLKILKDSSTVCVCVVLI